MDTSKEYIKMCEKAVEIQNLKKVKNGFKIEFGDFFIIGDNRIHLCSVVNDYSFSLKNNITWLPRQDQLQEIVKNTLKHQISSTYAFIISFMNYCHLERHDIDRNISMEQLWLAFVMKENYYKKWNGEDWEVV